MPIAGKANATVRLTILSCSVIFVFAGCSSHYEDEDVASEGFSDALRALQAGAVVSAKATTGTFLKTSTADSSSLPETEECGIGRDDIVKLKGPTRVGKHVVGTLMSAHGCSVKFNGGARVYVFKEHYSWPVALPSNADESDVTGSGSSLAGPCAGTVLDRAVKCATDQGARVLSYYRSPADQERVRRQNQCTDRCTGMDGCVLPTAGCTSSPHTTCRAVDLVADGAPLSRAALAACGLAKTTLPHVNHYDLVK